MIFHSILCYLLFDDYASVIYYRCNMQLNVYVKYIYIYVIGAVVVVLSSVAVTMLLITLLMVLLLMAMLVSVRDWSL